MSNPGVTGLTVVTDATSSVTPGSTSQALLRGILRAKVAREGDLR